jgi:hypothetical protein
VREQLVTSWGTNGEVFGRAMVTSAVQYWPSPLVAYVDAVSDVPVLTRRTGDIPGWLETQARLPIRSDNPRRYKATGYLWNAAKFAVKVFVWRDAAERLERGILTWLDADTVMLRAVPRDLPATMLGDADVAYLGRKDMHPETGCVVFRIPEALPLLRWCCDRYRSGRYRKIATGWTDCHVLRAGLAALKVPARDLTSDKSAEWRSTVDAMALSPLGPYVTHLKGKARKREALAC